MKTTMKQLATGTLAAILMFVGSIKAEATKTNVSGHENMETALQIENWMMDETLWNTNSINLAEFTQETETVLALEAWMTDSKSWSFNSNIIAETETSLEIENWMTDDTNWKVNNFEKDTELKVEQWMICENIWNKY